MPSLRFLEKEGILEITRVCSRGAAWAGEQLRLVSAILVSKFLLLPFCPVKPLPQQRVPGTAVFVLGLFPWLNISQLV